MFWDIVIFLAVIGLVVIGVIIVVKRILALDKREEDAARKYQRLLKNSTKDMKEIVAELKKRDEEIQQLKGNYNELKNTFQQYQDMIDQEVLCIHGRAKVIVEIANNIINLNKSFQNTLCLVDQALQDNCPKETIEELLVQAEKDLALQQKYQGQLSDEEQGLRQIME